MDFVVQSNALLAHTFGLGTGVVGFGADREVCILDFGLHVQPVAREPGVPYLAGEEILGSIEIHVQEQTRIARLTARLSGQAHTGWRNKASDILFESTELIMDEYLDLTKCVISFNLLKLV